MLLQCVKFKSICEEREALLATRRAFGDPSLSHAYGRNSRASAILYPDTEVPHCMLGSARTHIIEATNRNELLSNGATNTMCTVWTTTT